MSDNLDNSKNNVDTSILDITTTLTPKLDTSSSNMDTSSSNVDTSISMDTLPLITGKPRMKKEDLEQIILNVCKSEHKTLDEIGHLIDKAPKYLKNNIIPSLVASGKLERLFPNIPNHPNQAYKSAE